jgi:hypothetical protein
LGIRSFVAGRWFLHAPGIVADDTAVWRHDIDRRRGRVVFNMQRHASALLATGPLPAATALAANQTNWLLSIQATQNIDAPTLTSS